MLVARRHAALRRTARLAPASLVASFALLVVAGPALAADSASISVTTPDGHSDPAAYLPRVFTVSGKAGTSEHLYIKHRAAGGGACAPSAFTDSGTWLDASFYGQPVNGSFSLQRVLTWRSPGAWTFCFWLAGDETAVPPTPLTQTITFRPSAGTIGATITPATPRPGEQAELTVAGSSEAARRVYAKLRLADGTSCAPSYDADPGGSLFDGWSVDGAFSLNATYTQARAGQYLICLWLAGSSDDTLPIGGPQQQTFAVAKPPRPIVSWAATLSCTTRARIRRVRARTRKSICVSYRFSRPPPVGESVAVSFVTPRHVTYKTVHATWSAADAPTMTMGSLPAQAYKRRRGTWRAVLRVDGQWIKTKTFHVI